MENRKDLGVSKTGELRDAFLEQLEDDIALCAIEPIEGLLLKHKH